MAKKFHFLVQYKELVKNLRSTTTPKAAIVNHFSITKQTHLHTQGGDPLVGPGNQGSENPSEVLGNVEETIEADMNVVDTVEYRSREGLVGQLGDGCDNVRF
ncbi:unnamed protein product [Lathyrus oleraceus]